MTHRMVASSATSSMTAIDAFISSSWKSMLVKKLSTKVATDGRDMLLFRVGGGVSVEACGERAHDRDCSGKKVKRSEMI